MDANFRGVIFNLPYFFKSFIFKKPLGFLPFLHKNLVRHQHKHKPWFFCFFLAYKPPFTASIQILNLISIFASHSLVKVDFPLPLYFLELIYRLLFFSFLFWWELHMQECSYIGPFFVVFRLAVIYIYIYITEASEAPTIFHVMIIFFFFLF